MTSLSAKLSDRNQEVTELKTIKAENESTIAQDKEEIDSTKRELVIKTKQLKEIEQRCQRSVDESDSFRLRI